jgi:hypothetical protein
MKTSVLIQNGVTDSTVDLIYRLVELIPWPDQRLAMGDVTLALLNGSPRIAEAVFGWNRNTVALGVCEFQSGITCINDTANRKKPKAEEKEPKLLDDIHVIMTPQSQADSHLRNTLLYTNMTAQAVYDSLRKMGWSKKSLPTVRTISNILERHNYRLRTVAKSKVQKKTSSPIQSSKMCGR